MKSQVYRPLMSVAAALKALTTFLALFFVAEWPVFPSCAVILPCFMYVLCYKLGSLWISTDILRHWLSNERFVCNICIYIMHTEYIYIKYYCFFFTLWRGLFRVGFSYIENRKQCQSAQASFLQILFWGMFVIHAIVPVETPLYSSVRTALWNISKAIVD